MRRIIVLTFLSCPLLLVAMQEERDKYTEDEYKLFSIANRCEEIVTNSTAIKQNKNLRVVSELKKDGIQLQNGLLLDIKPNTVSICSKWGTFLIVKAVGKLSDLSTGIGETLLPEMKSKGLILIEKQPKKLLKDLYPNSCKSEINAQALANALGMGKTYRVKKYKNVPIEKAQLRLRDAYLSLDEIDSKIICMSKRYENDISHQEDKKVQISIVDP
jgi:hypothetical protein